MYFVFKRHFLNQMITSRLKVLIYITLFILIVLGPLVVPQYMCKSSFPQRKIDLQTELQATDIYVTLDREITICSVYIPPFFSLNSQHLDNLLQQLIVGHPKSEKKICWHF